MIIPGKCDDFDLICLFRNVALLFKSNGEMFVSGADDPAVDGVAVAGVEMFDNPGFWVVPGKYAGFILKPAKCACRPLG